jgi:Uma2 family endonuclease
MQPAKQPVPPLVTGEEYLRLERAAFEKHIFIDGRIIAMAGETLNHNRIVVRMSSLLDGQLLGKPCEPLSKDVKVRSGKLGPRNPRATAGLYSYPDIIVVCGGVEFDDEHQDVVTNPKVIIEVLSPSTELFDRTEKFARYRSWNPSLTDYVLVAQDSPRVERYTRSADGSWTYRDVDGLDAVLVIDSIGCTLRLADVYDRVTFPAPDPTPDPEE